MVHIVGDSHVSFFTGHHGLCPEFPALAPCALDDLSVVRVGGYLAHSLATPRHRVRGLIRRALASAPRHEPVLLVFGEIDCRNHVVYHAQRKSQRPEHAGRDLAVRYARAARELVGSRPLGFWAVTGAISDTILNPEYPVRGSLDQRRRAIDSFNRTLQIIAPELGAQFLSIAPHTSEPDGSPKLRYCADAVHADPRALPLACEQIISAAWPVDATRLLAQAHALSRLPAPEPISTGPWPRPIADALIDRAALRCAIMGARNIALFGAGAHTRRVGLTPYQSRGLCVRAIIDENPKQSHLLDVPIVPPDRLPNSIDAIVLSSDAHELVLDESARAHFAHRAIPIVRIYNPGDDAAPSPRSIQPGKRRAKLSRV